MKRPSSTAQLSRALSRVSVGQEVGAKSRWIGPVCKGGPGAEAFGWARLCLVGSAIGIVSENVCPSICIVQFAAKERRGVGRLGDLRSSWEIGNQNSANSASAIDTI